MIRLDVILLKHKIQLINALFYFIRGTFRYSVVLRINIFSLRQHVGTIGLFFRTLHGLIPIFNVDVDTNPDDLLEIKMEDFRVKRADYKLFNRIANPTVEHEFFDCWESLH